MVVRPEAGEKFVLWEVNNMMLMFAGLFTAAAGWSAIRNPEQLGMWLLFAAVALSFEGARNYVKGK